VLTRQAVKASRFVTRRSSHIFWTVDSQMAVRLSALGPDRLTPQEDSWYSFLVEPEPTPGPQYGWKD
jgi:hypothetical protein